MRVCSEPGCPELVERGRCSGCRSKARERFDSRRGSAAERGYGKDWQRRRRRFLAANPLCALCGGRAEVADHWPATRRQLLASGIPDPDAARHLRPLCTRCHNSETAKASHRQTTPFLIICGGAGTGKTEVRRRVAAALQATSVGPDDFDGDWSALYDELDTASTAVVECCRLPRALRRKARERRAAVVELTAKDSTRRRRLLDRGERQDRVDELLAHGPIGYEEPVEVALVIDTEQCDPDDAAGSVLTADLL